MSRSVKVVATGPLFDGTIEHQIDEGIDSFEREYAQEVADAIRARLKQVIRHSTGRYISKIDATSALGGWQVWDQRVVYGPWLEGASRMNRATRFKGYKTFRMITQRMDARAPAFAEMSLDRALT